MNNMKRNDIFLCQPHFDRPVIFCFHHAGGNARTYQQWTSCSKVDFIPVERPGHGFLMGKPFLTDIDKASALFAESIAELLCKRDLKFSLFGHSLGAIIAFCVAEKLKKYGLFPVCLQVAGRHAPQDTDKSAYRTSMGQEALLEEIRTYGYTPPELLENEEYCSYMLPMMFHDYELGESFHYNNEKLSVPVIAYYGSEDTGAEKEKMEEWSKVTDSIFKIRGFEGGHFFLMDKRYNFHNVLADDMLLFAHRKQFGKTDV